MDDNQILKNGGTEHDIEQYANNSGADLAKGDIITFTHPVLGTRTINAKPAYLGAPPEHTTAEKKQIIADIIELLEDFARHNAWIGLCSAYSMQNGNMQNTFPELLKTIRYYVKKSKSKNGFINENNINFVGLDKSGMNCAEQFSAVRIRILNNLLKRL